MIFIFLILLSFHLLDDRVTEWAIAGVTETEL
jgi:hypothetical protein